MHEAVLPGAAEIFPGGGVGVVLPLVHPGGGDPVHHHLHHVPERHLHAQESLLPVSRPHIHPVFKMVPVAPLVVKPGLRVSLLLPLRRVGAPGSLVIPHADGKLRPAVFGEIVEKSLAIKADPEAVLHHQPLVNGNRLKMSPDILDLHDKTPFSYPVPTGSPHSRQPRLILTAAAPVPFDPPPIRYSIPLSSGGRPPFFPAKIV